MRSHDDDIAMRYRLIGISILYIVTIAFRSFKFSDCMHYNSFTYKCFSLKSSEMTHINIYYLALNSNMRCHIYYIQRIVNLV